MENQFGTTPAQASQPLVESLTKINEQQATQISKLTAEVKKMAAQIAWFQKQMFGRKSEKHIVIDNQPSLFDTAELETPSETSEQPEVEPEEEKITYKRKKSQKGTSKPRET